MIKYDFKANPWQVIERNFPTNRGPKQRLSFLLRYAILAPSSHNTQPWKFAVADQEIRVYVNNDRWLRVADRDRRELYTSVGCALENLLLAAEHFGYGHAVSYFPDPGNDRFVASVKMIDGGGSQRFRGGEMFEAIFARHTNHKQYEARTIARSKLEQIESCSGDDDISILLTDEAGVRRKVDDLINRADAIQFSDPEFCEELAYWISKGVFGVPWLLSKLGHLAVSYLDLGQITPKREPELLMSAPVFGLISSKADDRETQVRVGQVFERVYLTVAMLGLAIQPMSQLVQIPGIKSELVHLAPEGLTPQQPFRLGYAEPEGKHTPRRNLEEAIA